ncbi:MAG: hypothetical protein LBP60_05415 [Spirochaetaceae bacterium]|jgi:hypothetical protein|nr:hypothetical protein [Spirochaetaceae bacterium]
MQELDASTHRNIPELDERAVTGYTKNCMGRLPVIALLVLISCRGDPPAGTADSPPRTVPPSQNREVVELPSHQAENIPGVRSPEPASVPAEPVFDPSSITREEHDNTKLEIQQLIQKLNGIIRAKDYHTWVSYLDSSYFATISSPEYLEQVSKSTVLVRQRIVLNSTQDYFNHVVVPSRAHDRVDEIEFISRTRVKAYTINNAGNRLRLYDLERTNSGWKIIN